MQREVDDEGGSVSDLAKDRDLLQAFRRGQAGALTQVYQAHVAAVARVVERVLRDPQVTSDLVQDIFIKAFAERARLGYDGLRPYRPYLMQIARNALTDHLRRLGRQVPELEREVDLASAEDGPAASGDEVFASAEDELHWHQLQLATRRYVATLPAPLQRFVKLRFEDELSQRDLVAQLGLSRWQVRAYEQQVQQGLRRHLETVSLSDT